MPNNTIECQASLPEKLGGSGKTSWLDRKTAALVAYRLAALALAGGPLPPLAAAISVVSLLACLAGCLAFGLHQAGWTAMDHDSVSELLRYGLIGTVLPIAALVVGAALPLIVATALQATRKHESTGRR